MATCRNCRKSHRDGSVQLVELQKFIATEGVLSGSQLKVPALRLSRLECVCGWSIEVFHEGGALTGLPNTEVWPEGSTPPGT